MEQREGGAKGDLRLEAEPGDPLYWAELETGRAKVNPHSGEVADEEPRG